MLFFPQLSSGAVAQLPLKRKETSRSARNVMPDGRVIELFDDGSRQIAWDLNYTGLSGAERDAVVKLFNDCAGRLQTFTFHDPSDNLLLWSEDLSQSAWLKDPLLQVTAGLQDPRGGTACIRLINGGQAPQRVVQEIAADPSGQLCFSLQVRSPAAGSIGLVRKTDSGERVLTVASGPTWTRVFDSSRLALSGERVWAGIELQPGMQADVYGLQLEAQIAPGTYKKTMSRGGVHVNTRFDSDDLSVLQTAPDQFSLALRLVSPA